jgi:hypothetical protein
MSGLRMALVTWVTLARMLEPLLSRLSDRYHLVAPHHPVCSSVC